MVMQPLTPLAESMEANAMVWAHLCLADGCDNVAHAGQRLCAECRALPPLCRDCGGKCEEPQTCESCGWPCNQAMALEL